MLRPLILQQHLRLFDGRQAKTFVVPKSPSLYASWVQVFPSISKRCTGLDTSGHFPSLFMRNAQALGTAHSFSVRVEGPKKVKNKLNATWNTTPCNEFLFFLVTVLYLKSSVYFPLLECVSIARALSRFAHVRYAEGLALRCFSVLKVLHTLLLSSAIYYPRHLSGCCTFFVCLLAHSSTFLRKCMCLPLLWL